MSKNPFVKTIIKFIDEHPTFKKIFSHHKQTYNIEILFDALIFKLKTGISYRNIEDTNYEVNWNSLHYFNRKLERCKLFNFFFNEYTSYYVDNMYDNIEDFFVDSTLIANKYGIDNISYNPQLQKHKSTKLSAIIDDNGIPLIYDIINSNTHDATIFSKEIETIAIKYPKLCTGNKKFICDSAYDSIPLKNKLIEYNLGNIICPKNKRNTKNENKLNDMKLKLSEKMKLNKRSSIEHLNNILKKYKTINVRYIKYTKYFNNYVLLAFLLTIYNKIGNIKNYK